MSNVGTSTSCRCAARRPRRRFRQYHHVFTADGPLEELRVEVDGEVETHKAPMAWCAALSNAFRRPVLARHRADPTTARSATLRKSATPAAAWCSRNCTACWIACSKISPATARPATMPPHPHRSMRPAFRRKHGAPKDLAHIFIGSARTLGIRHVLSAAISASRMPKPTPATPGGSLRARSGLGWLRSVQRSLPDRRPCPRRHRARFAPAPRRCAARALASAPDFGRRYQGRSVTLPAARRRML